MTHPTQWRLLAHCALPRAVWVLSESAPYPRLSVALRAVGCDFSERTMRLAPHPPALTVLSA